jgi:NhaP-type Na+/H+ or K+/H+ antiporter
MALGRLVWLIVGGVGTGVLLGMLVTWLERRIDDAPVEIIVSIITPYAAYLLGERIGASGVLSVVACGLLVSRRSNEFFSPSARMQVGSVWRSLDFTLNGLVFCLIGLQLPYVLGGITHRYSWQTLLEYGVVFSGVLIALRLVWMYPASWLAWWIRARISKEGITRPTAARIFVGGWTGMRGVVTLAAAIGLPNTLADGRPFEQRDLIVFLAFCVILVTLVGQGLTLPSLIRALGLAGVDTEVVEERRLARRVALEAAIDWLKGESEHCDAAALPGFEHMLRIYEARLETVSDDVQPEVSERAVKLQELMRGAARQQRQALLKLRADGRVGDEAVRVVERELDLAETRLDVASL